MGQARRTRSGATDSRTWRTAARWSVQEAEQALGDWEDSGLTVLEFCRKHGLRAQRIGKWLGKLRGPGVSRDQSGGAVIKGASRQLEPVHWVEARVVDTHAKGFAGRQGVSTIKVHLVGGGVIDAVVPDAVEPEWLARLAVGLETARD